MYRACILAMLVASSAAAATSINCEQCADLNREQAPFQIWGNTYYVGVHGLSSVLITSPGGHILIDGALPQSAPLIARHIEQLGLKVKDVKVILNSHVHFDHAGGIAELQKLSGARVIASDIAAKVLRTGKVDRNDPQFGILQPFPAAKNVEALGARETVEVGELKVHVIHTPGHTPGGTSWTWRSCESDVCQDVVYGDSLNAISDDTFKYAGDERYPTAASDMRASIAAISAAPCNVLIAAHPNLTGLLTVFDAQGSGDRHELIDASACKRYAEAGKEKLEKRLVDESLGR